MREIEELFLRAIEERVFPSASILVFEGENILFSGFYGTFSYENKKEVDQNSLYDIASLTKPLATSLSIAMLKKYKELDLDDEMGYFFEEFKRPDRLGITIRELMNHVSGLPAHSEYYNEIPQDIWGSQQAINEVYKRVMSEEIVDRGKVLYSDIDYIILGFLIERVTSVSIRDFYVENVLRVLKIGESDFCHNERFRKEERMVPVTENFVGVDDENARVLGGIAGHSGLFSNVYEIHKILCEIYKSFNKIDYALLPPEITQDLLKKARDFAPSMFRGGFDTPLKSGSQYGDYFGIDSIGHLGFTGTSFIMDLVTGRGVILLTNRVCPDRKNNKIREFRRIAHNNIAKLFFSK